jgi:hypothetical protein
MQVTAMRGWIKSGSRPCRARLNDRPPSDSSTVSRGMSRVMKTSLERRSSLGPGGKLHGRMANMLDGLHDHRARSPLHVEHALDAEHVLAR